MAAGAASRASREPCVQALERAPEHTPHDSGRLGLRTGAVSGNGPSMAHSLAHACVIRLATARRLEPRLSRAGMCRARRWSPLLGGPGSCAQRALCPVEGRQAAGRPPRVYLGWKPTHVRPATDARKIPAAAGDRWETDEASARPGGQGLPTLSILRRDVRRQSAVATSRQVHTLASARTLWIAFKPETASACLSRASLGDVGPSPDHQISWLSDVRSHTCAAVKRKRPAERGGFSCEEEFSTQGSQGRRSHAPGALSRRPAITESLHAAADELLGAPFPLPESPGDGSRRTSAPLSSRWRAPAIGDQL